MILHEELQRDPIIQEAIVNASCNLEPGQSLFTYRFMGAICFRFVRNRRRFRFWYRLFDPVFITSHELYSKDTVKIIGMLIEKRGERLTI